MLLTLLLTLVFILSVCLLLYAAVALIQDRRFFTTAPKDIQAAAIEHPERFPGAHALGWVLGRHKERLFFPAALAAVRRHALSLEGF